jgi:DNA-binding XRE family transcriptional regulator
LAAFGFVVALGGSPTSASAATALLMPDGTSATPRTVIPFLRETAGGTEAAGRKIAEVRRISGLTWEELAATMRVSRRTLHLWANGRPIAAANEERLARLLATVRSVDRGTARATRSVIMDPTGSDEHLPLDLLAQQRFDDFIALVGRGSGRADGPSLTLSAASRATRTPPSPVDLLGALQDAVETAPRSFVPSKTVRRPAHQA